MKFMPERRTISGRRFVIFIALIVAAPLMYSITSLNGKTTDGSTAVVVRLDPKLSLRVTELRYWPFEALRAPSDSEEFGEGALVAAGSNSAFTCFLPFSYYQTGGPFH